MTILASTTALAMAIALFFELRRDLMMLQQNSYRNSRYMQWLRESGDSTSMSRLCILIIFFVGLTNLHLSVVALGSALLYGVIRTWQLATKRYKKPLVMTRRAARIMVTSIIITIGIACVSTLLIGDVYAPYAFVAAESLTACYALSHGIIMAACFILIPIEKAINRRYINDARRRIADMPRLKVIGITGSYGKTSTKHFLNHILAEQFSVCMTPGNFNTTLGVVRTIREYLKPYDEIFIAEMGAKQRGDIREICDIVHPCMGIITAVGPQHLQSFKTIENVRDTKFELADALPADGLAVVNNDFEMIRTRKVDNVAVARYAVDNTDEASYRACDITTTAHGTSFTIIGLEGLHLQLQTPLVGRCNISNITAAVIIALKLGVPAPKIAVAVRTLSQVEHRLSVRRLPSSYTILDDAYNSNPGGAEMALEVLADMAQDSQGRAIVVTPGMIELGERQEELNLAFGTQIGRKADIALVIGQYNHDAIIQGIEETKDTENGKGTEILAFDTFAQAQQYIVMHAGQGDVVLFENDLPDTFK